MDGCVMCEWMDEYMCVWMDEWIACCVYGCLSVCVCVSVCLSGYELSKILSIHTSKDLQLNP